MIKSNLLKLAAVTALLLLAPRISNAADYKIDPVHSKITFKVKHLGISWVPGKFDDFSGEFSYDPAKVSASKATASIKAKSINTDNEKRDTHLKSPEFLNSDQFSDISFETSKITPVNKSTFKAAGTLKIKDISKPVVLDVEYHGSAKGMEGEERAAYTATTTVHRKDFGIVWNKLLEAGGLAVGEDVFVTIEIEGIKS